MDRMGYVVGLIQSQSSVPGTQDTRDHTHSMDTHTRETMGGTSSTSGTERDQKLSTAMELLVLGALLPTVKENEYVGVDAEKLRLPRSMRSEHYYNPVASICCRTSSGRTSWGCMRAKGHGPVHIAYAGDTFCAYWVDK